MYQLVEFDDGKWGVRKNHRGSTTLFDYLQPERCGWLLNVPSEWWFSPEYVRKYCLMSKEQATREYDKLVKAEQDVKRTNRPLAINVIERSSDIQD